MYDDVGVNIVDDSLLRVPRTMTSKAFYVEVLNRITPIRNECIKANGNIAPQPNSPAAKLATILVFISEKTAADDYNVLKLKERLSKLSSELAELEIPGNIISSYYSWAKSFMVYSPSQKVDKIVSDLKDIEISDIPKSGANMPQDMVPKTRYEQLAEQHAQLKENTVSKQEAEAQLAKAKAEIEAWKKKASELEESTVSKDKAEADVKAAEEKAKALKQQLEVAQAKEAEERKELNALKLSTVSTQEAQTKLTTAEEEAKALKKQLEVAQAKETEERLKLAELKLVVKQKEAEVEEAKVNVKLAEAHAETLVAEAKREAEREKNTALEALKDELAKKETIRKREADAKVSAAEAKADQLRQQLAELKDNTVSKQEAEAQLAKAKADAKDWKKQVSELRASTVSKDQAQADVTAAKERARALKQQLEAALAKEAEERERLQTLESSTVPKAQAQADVAAAEAKADKLARQLAEAQQKEAAERAKLKKQELIVKQKEAEAKAAEEKAKQAQQKAAAKVQDASREAEARIQQEIERVKQETEAANLAEFEKLQAKLRETEQTLTKVKGDLNKFGDLLVDSGKTPPETPYYVRKSARYDRKLPNYESRFAVPNTVAASHSYSALPTRPTYTHTTALDALKPLLGNVVAQTLIDLRKKYEECKTGTNTKAAGMIKYLISKILVNHLTYYPKNGMTGVKSFVEPINRCAKDRNYKDLLLEMIFPLPAKSSCGGLIEFFNNIAMREVPQFTCTLTIDEKKLELAKVMKNYFNLEDKYIERVNTSLDKSISTFNNRYV